MKRLLWLIVLTAGLVAMVTGCGGTSRYDGRLAAADSLMLDDPDSALALVEAIDAGSLTTDGDRAYRDLLLTQARYRCYIAATSDSAINRALAYYRAHDGEREKLTRCYLYKGAVMGELGQVDSAMFHYKTAEATAAPDDYFNLGYAKLRIASLYKDQVSQDSVAINKYKEAISYFTALNDTIYLISCYGGLGAVCGVKHPDSTEYYLTYAIKLAQQFKPSMQYTYKSKLAGLYYYGYHNHKRANELAMDVFRHGRGYCCENQYFYYAAWTYIRMGMLDSAKYVFKNTPLPKDAVDSMNRLQLEAEISQAENDALAYHSNLLKSREKEIQIRSSSQIGRLKDTESDFQRLKAKQQQSVVNRRNHLLILVLSVVLALSFILVWLIVRQKQAVKSSIEERKEMERILAATVAELKEKEQLQGSVSELFGHRIDALMELYDNLKFKSKDQANKRKRTIIPLSSVIMGLSEDYQAMDIKLSDDFWEKIKLSVNGEYDGIISFIEKKYPDLTIKERELFCLLCANVPPQIIKLCMNYTNVKTVYNRINIVIRKKMGLEMSLKEFLEAYMRGEF